MEHTIASRKAVEWESLNAKTENKTTSIRRLALPCKSTNAQLQIHAFTDASGTAFATTIYMRAETNGFMSTSLIFAKSRLRPKDKRLTIPQRNFKLARKPEDSEVVEFYTSNEAVEFDTIFQVDKL